MDKVQKYNLFKMVLIFSACLANLIMHAKSKSKNLKERDCFGDLSRDGRIILKLTKNKQDLKT
jgi:hypothetical protein